MIRLYLDLQVARYNEIYYHSRGSSCRRWALAMNVMSALASCGALTGMLNGVPVGKWLIVGLTVGAAVCAAIGPVFGMEARASRLEAAAFGHGVLRDRIKRLLNDLKMGEVESEHQARDREIDSFRTALTALDEPPHERTCKNAWAQAEREFPSGSAWDLV